MILRHEFLHSLFTRLFLLKSQETSIQLLRYLFVGGIAALVDFSGFMIMTTVFQTHYLLAQTVGFMVGISTNYTLSTLWIFESRHKRLTETSLFLATGLIGLLLSYALLWFLIDILGIIWFENAVAKLITIGVVLLWNFSSRKWFVFQ